MCLIITLLMLALAIQSFIQEQWIAGALQLIIALGFALLLLRNIILVRQQKQGCANSNCSMSTWFTTLFKKREK